MLTINLLFYYILCSLQNHLFHRFYHRKQSAHQLFYQKVNTTIIRFGYFDSPRVGHIHRKKMSIEYCVSIIEWVLKQKHRVKDITVCP